MADPVITSVISVAGALLVAVAGYVFTKRAERESNWRAEKLTRYKEFVASLSGVIENESTPEGQVRFAQACNDILLFAPQQVLKTLDEFHDEVRISNPNKSKQRHDALLTRLLFEIRKDIGVRPADDETSFQVQLWASGVPSNQKRHRS